MKSKTATTHIAPKRAALIPVARISASVANIGTVSATTATLTVIVAVLRLRFPRLLILASHVRVMKRK